jgi:hypothetical protein
MIFYRVAFWLPGIVAAVSLVFALKTQILSRPSTAIIVFAVGLILQTMGALFSPAWVLGLVCQVGLAISLQVKFRLDGL